MNTKLYTVNYTKYSGMRWVDLIGFFLIFKILNIYSLQLYESLMKTRGLKTLEYKQPQKANSSG